MNYDPSERWYAIRVRYQYEPIVEKALNNKNFSPLNLSYNVEKNSPKKKKIVSRYFFPGYMFIRTLLSAESHVEILKTIGVVEVIKDSRGPIPIPDDQIENIMKLKKYEGTFFNSPVFETGMSVRIISGPLKGVKGRVDQINKNLIKIGVLAIPGSIGIELPLSFLEIIPENE